LHPTFYQGLCPPSYIQAMREGAPAAAAAAAAANIRARRPPLVPKELIVPVCQRLAFVLFVMCSTALSLRLFALWKMGKFRHIGAAERLLNASFSPLSPSNGTVRFFLDIGDGHHGEASSTKLLEEHGWRGVCARPFPDAQRACKAISMPVVAEDGDQVTVDDCAQKPLMEVLLSVATKRTRNCPKVVRAGVGIKEVLQLSQAPPVIDYLVLDTDGASLSILEKFPFNEHCVRSWSVKHSQAGTSAIRKLFASRGCRSKDVGNIHWARCRCSDFSAGLLQKRLIPRRGFAQARAETLKRSHRDRKKSRGVALASSGMMADEITESGSLMRRSD